jgi:hypothetical protein
MISKIKLVYLILFISIAGLSSIIPQKKEKANQISDETKSCIDCHESVTPGIVSDWKLSRHSQFTFQEALKKTPLEKRVSSKSVSDNLNTVVVGCYECHSLNTKNHADNFEHYGYSINVIVSPKDCSTCHIEEYEQYSGSKKAHALDNLRKNPVYSALVESIDGVKQVDKLNIKNLPASHFSKNETCYACHGTEVKVEGKKIIHTETDDIEVPKLTNWPNQGVGRINPDGSYGACTACHPRHSFSIEVARTPYTCGQCHLEPDVPAFNVYKESKHGNIFDARKDLWEWSAVPWVLGKNFNAPTCAACHNSLLTSASGDVIVKRTHDFGARLWVRIFGLIYSHPQPKSGKTYEIKNKDGLPLPTTFGNVKADEFLLTKDDQAKRKSEMEKVCLSCHNTDWVEGHFEKFDNSVMEADKMVEASTKLLSEAWNEKLADNKNPFDEPIEQRWIKQWLFYANSVRYGSAMGGPDYAAFKNGWWELSNNLSEMHLMIRLMQNAKK